jgi:hypothetical protein
MIKCINGHSAYKNAMTMAIVAIPVAPPLAWGATDLHGSEHL